MRSHEYQTSAREMLGLIAPLAGALLLFLGCLVVASQLAQRWPAPPPRSADAVIIREKDRAARSALQAAALFLGDSSCMMDISSPEFRRLRPELEFWNLGTLSTLGFDSFAGLLDTCATSNPARLKTVVLLVSPEMLRATSSLERARKVRARTDRNERVASVPNDSETSFDPEMLWDLTGLAFLRTNVVPRLFDSPYSGTFGEWYGFNSGLRDFLERNRGCAVDPENPQWPLVPGGSAYRVIHAELRDRLQKFRAVLPPGVRLLAGITPAPRGSVPENYVHIYRSNLETLKTLSGADDILSALPATLPDHLFTTETHLSEHGSVEFTHRLDQALPKEFTLHGEARREKLLFPPIPQIAGPR